MGFNRLVVKGMKLYKVEAIVLRSRSMREADRVLTLYSRQMGKIKAVAHGINKPASRKRGAAQPFCYSRFMLRRGRDIDSVSQCEGIEMFPGLRSNLDTLAHASYFCELTDAFTEEGEPSEKIFRLLLTGLSRLGYGDDFLLSRAFEIKLVSMLGYEPVIKLCVGCGRDILAGQVKFNPSLGGALCPQCASQEEGGFSCARASIEVLNLLLKWEFENLTKLKVDARTRDEIQFLLNKYIEYYLEHRLKSVKFLNLLQKNE